MYLERNKVKECLQENYEIMQLKQRRVCTKEREGVSVVKRRERRGIRVHNKTIKERVYQTLKVISNSTSIFCRKKGW